MKSIPCRHLNTTGLYTYLSTTLLRLHREAYNSALAMARLAERAYRFERGDDGATFLEAGYWDASRAGLLSGEGLLIALQNLELRFIETNYRSLEINQSFSLLQVDPEALLQLKEKGTCEFAIPEFFFDLFYPGHYRRQLKSARLTIPCITGPYGNVSATLTLVESQLRNEPKLGVAHLRQVLCQRTVSIATSTAQSDAGVFELNFRDERYMPFEGAGAISTWQLSLPSNFRPFDYQTISDVIIHLSYTAEQDGVLRSEVEKENGAAMGSILHYLQNKSLTRVFSLRHDFSSVFHRLLHSPVGTEVEIEITDRHFPLFLSGREKQIKPRQCRLLLRTQAGQSITGFSILIDEEVNASGFSHDDQLGMWAAELGGENDPAFPAHIVDKHTFKISTAGDLAPTGPQADNTLSIAPEKLADVLLYFEYGIGAEENA